MKDENIVIGQTCEWNTKRRALKHRKPPEETLRCIVIKQVWRPDRLAQVVTTDGTKTSVKFDFLRKNYHPLNPELKVMVEDV